jgi:glycosyltransferase involved in cell wall biosynthesis
VKIVLANDYARVTGGADLHCLELAEGLRERGHHVAFIATADERNTDKNGIFIPAIVTRETRAKTTGFRAIGVALKAIWNPNAAAATRDLLGTFRPDIVHAHKLYPQLSVAPVVVASKLGIPVVQTLHDYEFISASAIDDTGNWRDRDEERASYRALNTMLFGVKRWIHAPRVNSWISVSRSASQLYGQHGISTTVLPNFTDDGPLTPPNFEERNGVLFAGRLSEEKGTRHMLELARRLPWLSVLIAGDGALASEVRDAERGLQNLRYLGWLDQDAMRHELASVRLAIVPSLWKEPAGLTALEAMAAGTPLIAYDSGGLAEYVSDAAAGIVVDPSVSSLEAAVKSVYDDRSRWETLSSSAREAVQRSHTRSRYLDRLEKVYGDAIASRSH